MVTNNITTKGKAIRVPALNWKVDIKAEEMLDDNSTIITFTHKTDELQYKGRVSNELTCLKVEEALYRAYRDKIKADLGHT